MSVTVAIRNAPTKPKAAMLPPQRAVLVIASPDGFLEVYGSPGVRVHIAERIDTRPAGEALADEYLAMRLPRWASEIYTADCLTTSHTIRPRSLEDEAERVLSLDLVRHATEVSRAAKLAKQTPRTIPAVSGGNLW